MYEKETLIGYAELSPLLRRAVISLKDQDWHKADAFCERVLDEEPENANAYIIKLMAFLNVQDEDALLVYERKIDNNPLFGKAVSFADESLRKKLEAVADGITERLNTRQRMLEEAERTDSYYRAKNLMHPNASEKELLDAMRLFEKSKGYLNSEELKRTCEDKISSLRKEIEARENDEHRKKILKGIMVTTAVVVIVVLFTIVRMRDCEARAQEIGRNLIGKSFSCSYSNAEFESGHLTASYVEYIDQTLKIRKNDVSIVTIKSVDFDGTIITVNGKKTFDEVTEDTEVCERGAVVVPLFGDPYVTIDGVSYIIDVNSKGVPIGLVRGNRRFD